LIAIVSGRHDRLGARLIPAMQAKALSVLAPDFFSRYELYWPDQSEMSGAIVSISPASDIFSFDFADCILSAGNWLDRDDLCKFADIRNSAVSEYSAHDFADFVRAATDKNLYFSNPFFKFSASSDVIRFCHEYSRSYFADQILQQFLRVDCLVRNRFGACPFVAVHCRRGDVYDYLIRRQLWPDYLGRVCTRYDLFYCLKKIGSGNVLVLSDDADYFEREMSLIGMDLSNFNLMYEAELRLSGFGGTEVVLIDVISKSSLLFQSRSAFSDAAGLFAPLKRILFGSLTNELESLPPFDFEDPENFLFHARTALWVGRNPKSLFARDGYLEAFIEAIALSDKTFAFHVDLFKTPGVRALMGRVEASSLLREKVQHLLGNLDKFPERCSILLPGVWRQWYQRSKEGFLALYGDLS